MIIKQGDCLELMKELPEKSIDLILCDLPYGTTDCKWDHIINFNDLWQQYNRIIKDNGAIVLFAAQPFTTKLIHSNLKHFKYCWYWKKNNVTGFTYARYQPMRTIEDICVFHKKMPTYNPQGLIKLEKPIIKDKRKDKNAIWDMGGLKTRYKQKYTNWPKHLLEFKNVTSAERLHPTQKPVELLEYFVKTYTNEGDTVLDNCMGVGSTGVACINANRKFIGFELDKTYFNLAEKRLFEAEVKNNEQNKNND